MDYLSRQKTFQQTLAAEGLDGFIVAHPPNLRYLCGYTGSNGLLLFLGGRPTFFTDGRYTEQARDEVQGARVVIPKGPLLQAAARLMPAGASRIGFEADHTSVAAAADMRKGMHKRAAAKPTSGLVMRQRIIKDVDELRVIRQAVRLGAKVFQAALKHVRPGVRESEVAGRLEFAAREAGADGMSFETIVAAGKRWALPHGRASAQPIPRRGFVVVDSGVILRGYCSDMTRTVHVGRVSRVEREWYESGAGSAVGGHCCRQTGRNSRRSGRSGSRSVLRKAKLDRYFTHSTGHGVGLEIHEPPRLGKAQQEEVAAGHGHHD